MKAIIATIAGATLALGAFTPALAADRVEKGEARLAKMIEGRTAGEPVSCISTIRSNGIEVIDNVAMVYNGGKTIYVARPTQPRQLSAFDVLVIDRFSPSQLCVQDAMRTVDRTHGYTTGVVFLKEFVPYTKEG